ncbi:MAG: glycosyltransferase family 9 protein [Candidatus Gastranaerophilales bacterium]|nr:glycosyltransferase family 9 protein [Candidatus Gastranaerophilales bacterium]
MKDIKKILAVNFGGIGDEILFMPVLRSLKSKFPDAKVTLCLEPRSKSIVNLCKDIDDVICADIKSNSKYFELLKFYFKALFGGYDIVVSSGSNKLIPVLLFFTGIKNRIGYNCGGFTAKLLTTAVELNKHQYAGRMYHDLVAELTGKPYENPKIEVEKSDLTEGLILVHPGVSKMSIRKNIIKSYENYKWAELVEMLLNSGEKVALAGGPDDDECISEILSHLKDKDTTNLHNFYGKTKNILELAELMAGAKAVICCDSAPMHISVAVGASTIALFGPTDEKKLIPEKDNIFVIKADCECRPCLWDKRSVSCDDKFCLNYSNEQIVEIVKSL